MRRGKVSASCAAGPQVRLPPRHVACTSQRIVPVFDRVRTSPFPALRRVGVPSMLCSRPLRSLLPSSSPAANAPWALQLLLLAFAPDLLFFRGSRCLPASRSEKWRLNSRGP